MLNLEKILLSQSPALFLAALVMLACFFFMKKKHRIRAALNMAGAVVCLIAGIALYYLGMLHEYFTIHDFWHIRVSGWVGLGVVALLTLLAAYRSIARLVKKRRAEKYAAKAEAERIRELETAKNVAYESGKADAIAAGKVSETVAEAAADSAAEAAAVGEET